MAKPDYTAFDAELIRLIKAGRDTFTQLDGHQPLAEMAKPFCLAKRGCYPQPEWRVIDRRLQALRKAGQIKHSAGKWHIVETDASKKRG